jgi:hypothetical protein
MRNIFEINLNKNVTPEAKALMGFKIFENHVSRNSRGIRMVLINIKVNRYSRG